MVESIRVCHAVGLDVHGALFEREVEGGEKHPERIAQASQEHAASCCVEAFRNVLGPTIVIEPREYWVKEQVAMIQLQKEDSDSDETMRQRDFILEVNKRTIQLMFPDLALSKEKWCELAKEVRKLRRQNKVPYVIYKFTRDFLKWFVEKHKSISLFLATGGERKKVKEEMEQQGISEDPFAHIFCAEDVGVNKLSSDFWGKVLERLGIAPHQLITVGNSVLLDGACTRYGIPVIILDRNGCEEEFYRARGETYYGVRLLKCGDDFPPRAPFIAFAKDHSQIQEWLERMLVE